MTYVGRPGIRWERVARPIALAASLGLLAVAEVIVRLRFDAVSVIRPARIEPISLQTGTGAVTPQFLLVLFLLCLLTTLPLAFLRPGTGAVTISAASLLFLTTVQTLPLASLAAQVAAGYRLGEKSSRALAVLLGGPFLVLALTEPADAGVRIVAVLLASLVPAAAAAGIASRARREALEGTAARQAIAGSLLEHTARGERARITRELHDVVAHHISMIAVQAETARLTVPGMPAAGARQLRGIGDTARAALTEMRRLLGVLREDADTTTTDDRRPQPGLGQLNDLLDEARDSSGAGIRLILSGPPAPLDPGVELAAYRIIQESLTNARRHAPGAAVDVEMRYAQHALHLRIRDNGPGPAGAGPSGSVPPGHGLLGICERAAAVGGRARVGAAIGAGFLIEATLPTRAAPAGEPEAVPRSGS
jgi:signal transduction histidine kinase